MPRPAARTTPATQPGRRVGADAARAEKGRDQARSDVVTAQKVITEDLVWIPLLIPNNVLVMNKGITGALATFVYAYGPWVGIPRRRVTVPDTG